MRSEKILKAPLFIAAATLPLLLGAFLLFLKDPPPWPDEGTSLYMAKTLLETGKMHAYNYGGIPEVAKEAGLGFPPIYFALLGGWTSIFGETIEVIRAFSLFIGVLCVAVFYFLILTSDEKSPRGWALTPPGLMAFWATILLSTNHQFAQASRWGRPEILTLLFILLALLFWFRFKNTSDDIRMTPLRWNTFFAFLFASLATATHPMGILAPAVIGLGILLTTASIKNKLRDFLGLGITIGAITAAFIITTQESLSSLYQAYLLSSSGKIKAPINLMGFGGGWVLSLLAVVELLVLLVLLYSSIKPARRDVPKNTLFILSATILSLIWIALNREGYYTVYVQPFLILSALAVIQYLPKLKWALISFLIFFNLYLQFFKIDYYTPSLAFYQLSEFNYHGLTREIESHLNTYRAGADRKLTIFLASIPDPYIDLSQNPHYQLYQAIDPYYPVSEVDYKKTLEGSDYVIFSWFPHEFLADYVAANSENITQVTGGGYTVSIAKLKKASPKTQP